MPKSFPNPSVTTLRAVSTKPTSNNVIPQTSDDSLNAYIRQISSIPVLTQEDEKETARIAKEGNQEQALKAKQKLVRANLRLVVNIARKTVHVSNLPMIDLIQEDLSSFINSTASVSLIVIGLSINIGMPDSM